MEIASSGYRETAPTAKNMAGRIPETTPAAGTGQDGDGVTLSPLARSLSGAAGKLFGSFSDGLRDKLVTLVQSGSLTADDVATGLTAYGQLAQAKPASLAPLFDPAAESDYQTRSMANISNALALASRRQNAVGDRPDLDREAEILRQESEALRQERQTRMQDRAARAVLDAETVRAGSTISLSQGVALSKLREAGVGDDIARELGLAR